jgi:hypothetical protein
MSFDAVAVHEGQLLGAADGYIAAFKLGQRLHLKHDLTGDDDYHKHMSRMPIIQLRSHLFILMFAWSLLLLQHGGC